MTQMLDRTALAQRPASLISAEKLHSLVSPAEHILVSKGIHFNTFRVLLSRANLIMCFGEDDKCGEIWDVDNDNNIPFSIVPDESVAETVGKSPLRVVGLGCNHQYVESRARHRRQVDVYHLGVVEEASFVIAAYRDRTDKVMQKLRAGEYCMGASEYPQSANILANLLGINVYFDKLPKGTGEVGGKLLPDVDIFAAICGTGKSLRDEGMEVLIPDVGSIVLDAYTVDDLHSRSEV